MRGEGRSPIAKIVRAIKPRLMECLEYIYIVLLIIRKARKLYPRYLLLAANLTHLFAAFVPHIVDENARDI